MFDLKTKQLTESHACSSSSTYKTLMLHLKGSTEHPNCSEMPNPRLTTRNYAGVLATTDQGHETKEVARGTSGSASSLRGAELQSDTSGSERQDNKQTDPSVWNGSEV